MFHKVFSFAGVLLLAGAAVFLIPGVSQAQRGGGGHGGGGGAHFGGGGAHFGGGGARFGGGTAHFGGGGARFGGARSGGGIGRFNGAGYGRSDYGYGRHRYYFGGYGYYPYYGGYYPYGYDSLSSPDDSGYTDSYGGTLPDYIGDALDSAPATGGTSSTPTAPPDTIAHLTVKAPADAQIWFNGERTAATGAVRRFNTPPLAAGKYTYDVRARWTKDGHEVTQTREVEVTPGSSVEVDFPAPSKS